MPEGGLLHCLPRLCRAAARINTLAGLSSAEIGQTAGMPDAGEVRSTPGPEGTVTSQLVLHPVPGVQPGQQQHLDQALGTALSTAGQLAAAAGALEGGAGLEVQSAFLAQGLSLLQHLQMGESTIERHLLRRHACVVFSECQDEHWRAASRPSIAVPAVC